jgi:hypothetical protein
MQLLFFLVDLLIDCYDLYLPQPQAHDDSFGGDHSPNSIDYVFSHFTGIFFTSTCYMIIHCSYKAHHGQVNFVFKLIVSIFISESLFNL